MPVQLRRTLSGTHSRGVSLVPSAVYIALALIAWNYEYINPLIMVPVSSVLGALGTVNGWDWAATKIITYKAMMEKPYNPPDDVRIVEAVAKMTDNQVWLCAVSLGYTLDEQMPEEPVLDGSEELTKSYAISAIDRADKSGGYLSPIRDTSDGSIERENRKALEAWLGKQGLIEPASGPKPARVKDTKLARERITG